jgi:hypothetical protein
MPSDGTPTRQPIAYSAQPVAQALTAADPQQLTPICWLPHVQPFSSTNEATGLRHRHEVLQLPDLQRPSPDANGYGLL